MLAQPGDSITINASKETEVDWFYVVDLLIVSYS